MIPPSTYHHNGNDGGDVGQKYWWLSYFQLRELGSVGLENAYHRWGNGVCPTQFQLTDSINCDMDKLVSALSMLLVWIRRVNVSDLLPAESWTIHIETVSFGWSFLALNTCSTRQRFQCRVITRQICHHHHHHLSTHSSTVSANK